MNSYKLRFVPLGGVIGVTKNMYVYELYENEMLKDILIVDCGIGFPTEHELGVDLIIPDISYLKDKIDKIRAIVLTHGHEDHTTGLPYHYVALGSPPIYTAKLTAAFVEHRLKEYGVRANINQIDFTKEYAIGGFRLSFIRMTHSIPDTMHLVIKTPVGNLYHGTDFKLDVNPPYGRGPDFYEITRAGHEGVLCLMSDCLGSEEEGLTLSESIVGQTFEDEMRKTKGKFIMTTFSSNISRIRQCVEAAIKFNRKIVFLGRSMRENTRVARDINYLPIPHSLLVDEEDVKRLPPNKLCLIVAGSQGQYDSALFKLARQLNKNIKISQGDKVIFSSDPIPGNESEVYALIEELSLQGADVVYSDIKDQLHASGHGNIADLKFLIRFTNPNYFIPIGGTIRHQRQYRKIVENLGYDIKNVFLLNEGNTVWFKDKKAYSGETIETKNIFVDAYGVGDIGNVVLRDRKTLSSEGMVFVVLTLDSMGKLVARPTILSRGFVFEQNEKKLFEEAARLIERVLKPRRENVIDVGSTQRDIEKQLEGFFFKEKGRKPLIVVETIQI